MSSASTQDDTPETAGVGLSAADSAADAMLARGDLPRAPMTTERVRELVHLLVPLDDDERARALVALVHAVAYEPERLRRDDLADLATDCAFARTRAFASASNIFLLEAVGPHAPEPEAR